MLGSKSTYFHQSKEWLRIGRKRLIQLLEIWRYDWSEISVYCKAYDYFCNNPDDYDGATIVKDLCHIPGLDINAMLHDYHYLIYNAGANFRTKWTADWIYAKEMERLGKGYAAWIRFAGLKLTGLPFVLYAKMKRGEVLYCQKENLLKDKEILLNE